MSTFQVSTTDAQDAAVKRATDAYNNSIPPPADKLTPLQFVLMSINMLLNTYISKFKQDDVTTKSELYQKASDVDKATIDAILQKYVS